MGLCSCFWRLLYVWRRNGIDLVAHPYRFGPFQAGFRGSIALWDTIVPDRAFCGAPANVLVGQQRSHDESSLTVLGYRHGARISTIAITPVLHSGHSRRE
jgi:hypothetical protein